MTISEKIAFFYHDRIIIIKFGCRSSLRVNYVNCVITEIITKVN